MVDSSIDPTIHRHGSWSTVTPAQAGWTYVSFGVRRLVAGDSFDLPADDQEKALVPLGGRARARAVGQEWTFGGRASVFDGLGSALYLPRDTSVRAVAETDLEIAVAQAPASAGFAPVLVTPDRLAIETRGAGNASRQIGNLLPPDFPADRLLVIEVWTPGGNWSSFPPHRHEHDVEGEAQLEETYYYRMRDAANGWAVQRVYSPERDFDLTQPVYDGDLLTIPWGYHTTVAAHGHDLYYLNVLAGPAAKRTLAASDDPRLAPLRAAWASMDVDPRVPLVPPHLA